MLEWKKTSLYSTQSASVYRSRVDRGEVRSACVRVECHIVWHHHRRAVGPIAAVESGMCGTACELDGNSGIIKLADSPVFSVKQSQPET
jgi:hypothetical protein